MLQTMAQLLQSLCKSPSDYFEEYIHQNVSAVVIEKYIQSGRYLTTPHINSHTNVKYYINKNEGDN
jgi:hypothetical protein